jgi:exodeoxyribonuclease VII large subunit
MEQYAPFQPVNILSVSQLTSYLRELLETNEILQDVWVRGELSNVSRPSSGHLYFTLKDSEAAIRCVMWRNAAARLGFAPDEGKAVEAHGGMGIYEVSGQVQLYVDTMRPAGEGELFQEYMRLKARLEAEGLFAPEIKQPLPELPKTIGIVTSPTGAALQDMLDTLRRRFPVAEVILSPTPVQGAEAPQGIVAALERLNREVRPDVILIGRGGGSIEDLWAFNDESVVRAVRASTSPVISGVGHETDFTLTDFAADRRAPTPTAAAEIAVPDKFELLAAIAELANRQTAIIHENLSSLHLELGQLQSEFIHLSPKYRINTSRQQLDEVNLRIRHALQRLLENRRFRLENLWRSLKSLNPQAVLNRGYAVVTRSEDGSIVRNSNQVRQDENIHIRVSRGGLDARVTGTDQE